MAVLDELDAPATAEAMGFGAVAAPVSWEMARSVFAKAIWAWFDEHKKDRIIKVSVKILFLPIRATLKVKDLELPLTVIFGPHP